MRRRLFILAIFSSIFTATLFGQPAGDSKVEVAPNYLPVNENASKKAKLLYYNLHHVSGKWVLFGHEDDLAYGVNWKAEPGRSDVKEVSGKYPAVFGWDLSKIGKYTHNIDTVDFAWMRKCIKEAYKMGGINTISWHLDNPVANSDSWDTTPAVAAILPGGSHHEWYLNKLNLAADYIKSLRSGGIFSHPIPIIFRPFHEHSGSWFWWGKEHCTGEEYKQLWRFTFNYLTKEKKVKNLLFAYAPDIVASKEEYMDRYPGNEYVDLLGLDNYHDVGSHGNPEDLTNRLRFVVELAKANGKIAALTETGLEGIPHTTWWTDVLLSSIKKDELSSQIVYVMVWRNAYLWKNHHYAPFVGHPSAADFIKFTNDPMIRMQSDAPALYSKIKW